MTPLSFVVIGRLDRPPMLRFAQGQAPTVVLIVETAPIALPDDAGAPSGGPRLATERHAVHFTGLEARSLYKRLQVDQRLLIHASPRQRRSDADPASGIRSEMLAHTIRILPDAQTQAVAVAGRDGEWRRRFLAGFFHRLRASREGGGSGSGSAPGSSGSAEEPRARRSVES
jgi:hypothetical protein